MLLGTLLLLYALTLTTVGVLVRVATRRIGGAQWPWWLFTFAALGLAVEPALLGWGALAGEDPGTTLPRVAGRLVFGVGLLAGVFGLIRFMRDWREDRERRFHRSIWSMMAEVYLLEPGSGRVVDSNRGRDRLADDPAGAPFAERLASGSDAFRAALERVSAPGSGRESMQLDLQGDERSTRPVTLVMERTVVDGTPMVALFVQDLSELRRTQEEARAQADLHRLLIESVAEAILVIDRDGCIRYGSPSVVNYIGRDPVGSSVLDLLPDDAAEPAGRLLQQIASDPRATSTGIVRTRSIGETGVLDVEYRLRHVDYPGVGPSVLVSALDVSARAGVERRFRERRRVVSDLIQLPQVAEGRVDEVARIVAAAGAEHLPVPRCSVWMVDDEIDGIRTLAAHEAGEDEVEPDRVRERAEAPRYFEALDLGRPVEITDTRTDPRGAELRPTYLDRYGITALLDAPILIAGRTRGVVCHEHVGGVREWTPEESGFATELAEVMVQTLQAAERRRRDEEREEMEAQLRVSQRMETIGVLAGGVAHDFNNLLTPILGYAELLQVEARERGERAGAAQEIVAACQRAAGLVNQLLTFSRNLEQKDRAAVRLEKVVEEVGGLIRASLPASIRVHMELAPALPPVEADATQLHQVVLNLATNAWQAMSGGTGVLRIELDEVDLGPDALERMPGLAEGRYLRLRVCDTGVGMEPDVAARIFEPFFTTKPVGEGTGLGLAVTHGIVTAHGGHIGVDTALGEGSMFTVHLPAAAELQPALPVVADDAREADVVDLLVIDDEGAILRFVVRVLERQGWGVEGFTEPGAALEAVRRRSEEGHPPDVVLTDQTMPETSGLEVASRIREIAPGTPVVLMSGFDALLTPEELRAVGVSSFLRKPFVANQLVDAVRDALGGRREPEQPDGAGAAAID